MLADPNANEDWQEVADTRDLIALLRKEGELKKKLNAAIEKAQRADDEIDETAAPKAYKEAIDAFSASISECVGEDLLSETAFVAVTARKLEATMLSKLQAAIEDAKKVLRKAISTAVVTRESPPLAACLDKLVNTDQLLRESCDDVVQIAENLLKELREEEAKKAAALKALKHSNDLAETALECTPDSIFDAIGRVFPTPIEDHLASALFVEVKEDHPEVLRAQSLIAKMKEVLKSIEEARTRLAEATVTAEKTREIAPLESTLDASLAVGVPHHCKEVVDARALMAILIAEADADTQRRLLEQLRQRLQKVSMHAKAFVMDVSHCAQIKMQLLTYVFCHCSSFFQCMLSKSYLPSHMTNPDVCVQGYRCGAIIPRVVPVTGRVGRLYCRRSRERVPNCGRCHGSNRPSEEGERTRGAVAS